MTNKTQKFPPFNVGDIYITEEIDTATTESPTRKQEILLALSRHARKDWGLAKKRYTEENEQAIKAGQGRIISKHKLTFGSVWVVTEQDQKKTTILFCKKY